MIQDAEGTLPLESLVLGKLGLKNPKKTIGANDADVALDIAGSAEGWNFRSTNRRSLRVEFPQSVNDNFIPKYN